MTVSASAAAPSGLGPHSPNPLSPSLPPVRRERGGFVGCAVRTFKAVQGAHSAPYPLLLLKTNPSLFSRRTGGRLGEEGRGDEGQRRPILGAFLTIFLATLLALPARGEDLHGRIQLLAKGRKGPDKGSDVRQAVVWFEPAGPHPVRPAGEPFEMVTRRKELVPRVLVIPRGSRVRFPNQDPILHNVFSVSSPNQFDLGLYREGPGKEKRFEEPGLVRVYCNVHHDMVAYVLVLDTPHWVSPSAAGDFVLTGLPKGAGKLTVWHEQGDPWTGTVELPQKTPVQVGLEIVRPLIPAHLNKQGQSYFRSQRDRYDNR